MLDLMKLNESIDVYLHFLTITLDYIYLIN